MRTRDSDVLRSGMRAARARADVPVLFGGMRLDNDVTVITETLGTRTRGLLNVQVRRGAGLGGRVSAEGAPRLVVDYGTSTDISHDYDRPVLGEGITSVIGLPIKLHGRTRGLLYLATRSATSLGERLLDDMQPIIDGVEREIRVRDEVDRRVASAAPPASHASTAELTNLRELQAELRQLAAEVDDADLRERLRAATARLIPAPPEAGVLSPRERDVLALVALGCSNAEVASRLAIGIETARGYLQHAMRKLDVHSRWAAVVEARRRGELI